MICNGIDHENMPHMQSRNVILCWRQCFFLCTVHFASKGESGMKEGRRLHTAPHVSQAPLVNTKGADVLLPDMPPISQISPAYCPPRRS
jgi:hypothetical protein